MNETDLKTPDEWCKLLDVTLLDHHGWDKPSHHLLVRSWDDLITETGFKLRASLCRQYVRVPEQPEPPSAGVPDLDDDLAGYQDELTSVKQERDALRAQLAASQQERAKLVVQLTDHVPHMEKTQQREREITRAVTFLRELEAKHVRGNAAVGRPQEHSSTLRLVRQAINILCPSTEPTPTNP